MDDLTNMKIERVHVVCLLCSPLSIEQSLYSSQVRRKQHGESWRQRGDNMESRGDNMESHGDNMESHGNNMESHGDMSTLHSTGIRDHWTCTIISMLIGHHFNKLGWFLLTKLDLCQSISDGHSSDLCSAINLTLVS